MNFIPCATWISRGVTKERPDKISLSEEELKRIIESGKEELGEIEAEESEPDEGTEINQGVDGIVENEDEDIEQKYDLDNYDDEDASTNPLAGLAGLSVYSSNDDDPYITLKDEPDSDEEDFIIKPDDNLIAVGHIDNDSSVLEFYVYNDGHYYVHHDILLPYLPLCIEWMNFDPTESENTPGNLVAIGSMSPVISVWDVDVVDSLEPAFKLGKRTKKKKKKDEDLQCGHTNAVLDLSWNKLVRNVLASGSVDTTVILWDVAVGSPVTIVDSYSDKVQSLEWHPFEAHMLLTGSCDKAVKVFDCRSVDSSCKQWSLDGEIERVIWNHFEPFYCLASTDRGFVYCLDARTTEPLWTISAHSEACTGLALSSQCAGCLVTASTDKTIKVWDIEQQRPTFVAEKTTKVGKINCLQSCPDEPFTFCCGGDYSSQNFDVENIFELSAVSHRFGARDLVAPSSSFSAEAVEGASQVQGIMDVEGPSNSSGTRRPPSPRLTNFVKKKRKKSFFNKKKSK